MSAGGRPVRVDYGAEERVQFNISLPREVKRALADSAERNDRRLGDEARLAVSTWLALSSWLEREPAA